MELVVRKLTRREQQIVRLLHRGWGPKEIAEHLEISPFTVAAHIRNVMAKRRVSNIVELIYKTRREFEK